MNIDELITAMDKSGYFPQLREWPQGSCVETAIRCDEEGNLQAPLIQVFTDRRGRWIMTVFGEKYLHIPDGQDAPAASIEMLRAMDRCMGFSPDVIRKYNLIELEPGEFRI